MRSETYRALHRAAGFELVKHLADFEGTVFDPAVDSGCVLVFRRAE